MGPPIEWWCEVSVEMGPPIERRCQVSNPLIKRNPLKFINFVLLKYIYIFLHTYILMGSIYVNTQLFHGSYGVYKMVKIWFLICLNWVALPPDTLRIQVWKTFPYITILVGCFDHQSYSTLGRNSLVGWSKVHHSDPRWDLKKKLGNEFLEVWRWCSCC